MHFLLIGSGAREHAIGWKLKSSRAVSKLSVVPGNPLLSELADACYDVSMDPVVLASLATEIGADVVVCGPEQPLAQGLGERLAGTKVRLFGPSAFASMLESSKSFAKDFMKEFGIPSANYEVFKRRDECEGAAFQVFEKDGAVVLKADGLAGGKGVFVCHSRSEVEEALRRLYSQQFAGALDRVVVEECLEGRECSYFLMLGEGEAVPLGFAVDFKRLLEGDKGPNTGGMGCYTPVPWLPSDAEERVMEKVVHPFLRGIAERGIAYTGFLYVGLMWTQDGPQVIEFNVRLGDPEAQVLAMSDPRDWGELILDKVGLARDSQASYEPAASNAREPTVGVVLASHDYPYGEGSRQNSACDPIPDAPSGEGQLCFAASVKRQQKGLLPKSGRVMTVVAKGQSFSRARDHVYKRVDQVKAVWGDHIRFRGDIADKVVDQ